MVMEFVIVSYLTLWVIGHDNRLDIALFFTMVGISTISKKWKGHGIYTQTAFLGVFWNSIACYLLLSQLKDPIVIKYVFFLPKYHYYNLYICESKYENNTFVNQNQIANYYKTKICIITSKLKWHQNDMHFTHRYIKQVNNQHTKLFCTRFIIMKEVMHNVT